MQPPTLMGRPSLSDAANFSSNWLLTIVGHWLLPINNTRIGFGGSSAETAFIATQATSNAMTQRFEFMIIGSFLGVGRLHMCRFASESSAILRR